MTKTPFTDEQLTAYLDDELNADTRAEITQALSEDDQLCDRLSALDLNLADVKSGFDALLDSAPAAPEMPATPALNTGNSSHRTTRWAGMAALLLLAVGVGGMGANALRDTGLNSWVEYVAVYHALYITDTLNNVQLDEASAAAGLTRATAAVNRPVELAHVSDLPGVTYKRSQILGFEGKALAQLTFLTDKGAPIAFCIYPSDTSDSPLKVTELEGMASVTWSADGHEYLIVGGTDSKHVRELANALTARL